MRAERVVVSPACVWTSGRSSGRASPSFNPPAEVVSSPLFAAAAAAFLGAAGFFSFVRFFLAAGTVSSVVVTAGDSLLAALRVERRRTGAADMVIDIPLAVVVFWSGRKNFGRVKRKIGER